MNVIDTTILGIVEGLTEFLPISSTGHMILTGHLLGLRGEEQATFEIFIQLGAILAVVCLYSQRFKMLFTEGTPGTFAGLRGWKLLVVTSLPAAILGLVAHHFIKEYLFQPVTVLWALAVGGLGILLVERLPMESTTETLDHLTIRQALLIGLFQCIALWPGMSRAAATIVGGLFAGLDRKLAAQYSFIAAVPIMVMAVGFDLLKSYKTILPGDWIYFALGFVIAFLSAIVAIKVFIHLLQRTTLVPFALYRLAVAVVFGWLILNGSLSALAQ